MLQMQRETRIGNMAKKTLLMDIKRKQKISNFITTNKSLFFDVFHAPLFPQRIERITT